MSGSDSEFDDATLAPEEARRCRKVARAKYTKLTTAIGSAISLSRPVETITLQKHSMTELYEECMRMHSRCSAAEMEVGGPGGLKCEKWATDLDDDYKRVMAEIDAYVSAKQAAYEEARKQKETTDASLARRLRDSELEVAAAKAAAKAADARAEAESSKLAASLLVVEMQKEALKRRYEEEDEEIARKRSLEDTARAEARTSGVMSTATTTQPDNIMGPSSSTPVRIAFQPDVSFIAAATSFRRYDTTGSGSSDTGTIPNTVDAWIFKPFPPVTQVPEGGDSNGHDGHVGEGNSLRRRSA